MEDRGLTSPQSHTARDNVSEHSRLLENSHLRGLEYTKLTDEEVWWRNHSDFLDQRGYRLRPRFLPGWKASWLEGGRGYEECEDGLMLLRSIIIDATRVSDGTIVVIKRVRANSEEVVIAQMLSSPERREDPKNHAVPILDYFVDDVDPEVAFLVMPLLRRSDDPPFATVSEVIDFIRQMLEGLVYFHSLDVAHRDCSGPNIMMDAKGMFPRGFHPDWQMYAPDGKTKARALRRSALPHPIRYYFIDFGISTWFRKDYLGFGDERDTLYKRRLVLGEDCLDQSAPELSSVFPYDPFLLDVYLVGNIIRRTLYEKYSNLRFLGDLAFDMTEPLQKNRPTAQAALSMFEAAVPQNRSYTYRWRLKQRGEKPLNSLLKDIQALGWEIRYQLSRLSSAILLPFRGRNKADYTSSNFVPTS